MPTCPVCAHVYESGANCPRCGSPAPEADDRTIMRPAAMAPSMTPSPSAPPMPPMPPMAPYPGQAAAPGPAAATTCPSCGATNPPGGTYCVQCGAALPAATPPQPTIGAFGAPNLPPNPPAAVPGQPPSLYAPYAPSAPYAAAPGVKPGTVTGAFVLFIILAAGGVFSVITNIVAAASPLSEYITGGAAIFVVLALLAAVMCGLSIWGAMLASKGAETTRIPAIGILAAAVVVFIINLVATFNVLSIVGLAIPIIIVGLVHSASAKAYLVN